MTPEARQKLKQMLLRDEAFKQFPYVDTEGNLTIAIGRNISPHGEGITLDEALMLLDNDINSRYNKLAHYFPWYLKLNEPRQIALVNMTFMGFEKFLQFHEMLFAFEAGDMNKAADEMLNSKWHTQVGDRAVRLANIIRTGEL